MPSRTTSPGAPTLVLIPTPGELEGLRAAGGLPLGRGLVELCGFGPIAAAARAATLLARLGPRRVVLVGIAGSYDAERAAVGSAPCFDSVALDGVGAGEGDDFRAAEELGFPLLAEGPEGAGIGGPLPLTGGPREGARLLTVCSAARSAGTVARRRARHPTAVAEDMEAYGVALACAAAGVPLAVVRGISNLAGEPRERWRIPEALAAARGALVARLDVAFP